MDNIHEHDNAQPMSLIYHRLEFLGGAAAAAHGKKVSHVVPKASIVGMLLDSHDLNAVVAQLPDAGKHVAFELEVAVDLWLLAAHADVALVDLEGAGLGGARVLEGVGLILPPQSNNLSRCSLLLRVPVNTVELDLVPLLSCPLDPSWDSLSPGSVS